MKLIKALELTEPMLITLIGGGGKTTTLFRLAEELSSISESIVITTTTAMFMPSASKYDLSIITRSVKEAKVKIRENTDKKRILLGKEVTPENKLKGFTPEEMDEIYRENTRFWFLVEGDGSNGRSLKVPDTHEPQVPFTSSLTIILIGADILGKELNKENVHRHHLVHKLIPKCGRYVDRNLISKLVFHPLGITKGIPQNSKKVILFNKIISSKRHEDIYNLSEEIIVRARAQEVNMRNDYKDYCKTIDRILLGEVQDKDPILEVLEEKRSKV